MQRILTGIQSTGIPHLGNLLGSIHPALALAKKNPQPAFFFIADLHTLTTQHDPQKIKHFTYATTAAWLAAGFDTQKDHLYRQSHIPQVCELTWYLTCFTPYPMLSNAHAFKDKAKQLSHVTAGLFTYPILMAADILLYHATHIPVGKDQQQHIEITRDIARTFNHQYGSLLTIPQAHIKEDVAIIPGTDGRKMSKSYHNTINIFDPEPLLAKTIMQIKTDSTPLNQPKNPDTCPLFNLFQLLATPTDTQQMRTNYLTPGYGYQAAKKELLHLILTTFSEQRKTFTHYMQAPHLLEKILQASEANVTPIAMQTLSTLRKAIGMHL